MDTKKACQILNIHEPFVEEDLKRAWRAAALKYHPDRNSHSDSNERFIEVQEAYTFLSMYDGEKCTNSLFENIRDIVTSGEMADSYRYFTLDLFRRLDRAKAMRLLGYLEKYATLFYFDDKIIEEMRTVLEETSDIVVIKPTVDNLFCSDIYCLVHNGETYYVPMWHDEITYSELIVRCVPELPSHMLLDEKNTLHVTIKANLTKVFHARGVNFSVGEKPFFVSGEKLHLVKKQTYIFKGQGIPLINQINAFDNSKHGDVMLHLELLF